MVNLGSLNAGDLAKNMLSEGAKIAGAEWKDISEVATHEFTIFTQRIVEIAQGLASGQLTEEVSGMLLSMARNHMVATIATLTTKLAMAIQKIVDAAVKAISAIVNTAIGFPLLV
jgi:hypothetical protein